MTFSDIVTIAPFVAAILLSAADPARRLRVPGQADAGAARRRSAAWRSSPSWS